MVYQGCSACHTVMRTRVKDASLNEDHRIIDFSDHTEKGAFSADLQPRTGRIEMREKKKRRKKKKERKEEKIFLTIFRRTDEGDWCDDHASPQA